MPILESIPNAKLHYNFVTHASEYNQNMKVSYKKKYQNIQYHF